MLAVELSIQHPIWVPGVELVQVSELMEELEEMVEQSFLLVQVQKMALLMAQALEPESWVLELVKKEQELVTKLERLPEEARLELDSLEHTKGQSWKLERLELQRESSSWAHKLELSREQEQ